MIETPQGFDRFVWTELLELRSAKRYQPETLVHRAADKHEPKIEVAVRYAFALGRKSIDRGLLKTATDTQTALAAVAAAPDAVAAALRQVLPQTLLAVLRAGGEAGVALLKRQLRAAGGPGSGRYPKGSGGNTGDQLLLSQPLVRLVDTPNTTSFILSDGRRAGSNHRHEVAAGYQLQKILKEGVIRYTPGEGIEVSAVPTEAQAQIIVDDFKYVWKTRLFIDVRGKDHIRLDDERLTVDGVRNYVKKVLQNTPEPSFTVRDLGGPGSGRYPKGSGGHTESDGVPSEGPFAEANRLEADRYTTEKVLRKLVEGGVTIENKHPSTNPHLNTTSKKVLDVLAKMKAEGLVMPNNIIITYTSEGEGHGPRASIEGHVETSKITGQTSTDMTLRVEIPESIPADVDLDDAVNVAYGMKSDVSLHAYNDTDFQFRHGYDKFTARTMRDVVIHEMGHVQAGHRGQLSHGPLLQQGTFGSTDSIRRASIRVSEYADRGSADEFLAEAFTRLYRGETLADDSQRLYDALNGPRVPKS